jgi:F420-dependent oxidoreductase-like protein
MRAGLFLAYWPWFSPEEQVSLALMADELGLDSVWISEAWGQDAVSVLGLLAGRTERIGLGSGLMQIPARQPTAAAMAAASLDVLSGGRFRLGLGVSGPQVSEGWYGVPFERPLRRTREYVEIVRMALARKTVSYEGREWTLPLPDGLGRPLKLLARPVQERVPIYLGAVGPKAVRQTGEIADGWLPFMLDPSDPRPLLEPLERGLAAAGRSRSEMDVAPCVPMALAADVDAARDAVRPWLAFYLGAMGAPEKNSTSSSRRARGTASRRTSASGCISRARARARRAPCPSSSSTRWRSPPRRRGSMLGWPRSSRRARTRSWSCRWARGRRSCARWRRRCGARMRDTAPPLHAARGPSAAAGPATTGRGRV